MSVAWNASGKQLIGTLNFLTRAIFPGRAFTRHMYAKIPKMNKAGKPLRQFHHIHIDGEFKSDCRVWLQFLAGEATGMLISRPFVDLKVFETSQTTDFYTDSSANPDLGFGCVFGKRWIFEWWEPNYIREFSPSIEYLELAALCIGVMSWGHLLTNCRIVIFCDNQAVV